MALRRRGKLLSIARQRAEAVKTRQPSPVMSFVGSEVKGVRVPAVMLGERLAELHAAVTALLRDRLVVIDEHTNAGLTAALAEMQAQAIVLGGLAFHTRDGLPAQLHHFINANMAGFAGLLDEDSRGDGP